MTLRTADLERRAQQLSRACRERAMGKSHSLHVASRLLAAAAELIGIAQEVDGTDEAAENRRLSEAYGMERARAERLSEQLAEATLRR